jgi:LPS O-antigen subunit length determinant protein (WzzB/FepE family)
VADDDAPKSAYEIALERLRKKDREEGVEERPLSDEQRTKIADIRKTYEARLAEREILHRSSLRKTADPVERETLEEQYRRDRERLGSERDRKIEEVRQGS